MKQCLATAMLDSLSGTRFAAFLFFLLPLPHSHVSLNLHAHRLYPPVRQSVDRSLLCC